MGSSAYDLDLARRIAVHAVQLLGQNRPPKRDRALVLAFALGDLLVRGGERVGIPGVMRPTASRAVIERMADTIIHQGEPQSLPPLFHPGSRDEIVILGDLWSSAAEVTNRISGLAANGAGGHVVQIVDVAEETFPYSGRVEFEEPEGAGSITVGRAEAWAADYIERVARHRAAIRAEAARGGWSFAVHRTERPASEILLALHARMSASADAPAAPAAGRADDGRGRPMMAGLPLAFASPLILLGLLALPVLWWLLRLIPPRPRRIAFPPTRILFEIEPKEETPARTPWWLTLLRLLLAALIIIAAAGPFGIRRPRARGRPARPCF